MHLDTYWDIIAIEISFQCVMKPNNYLVGYNSSVRRELNTMCDYDCVGEEYDAANTNASLDPHIGVRASECALAYPYKKVGNGLTQRPMQVIFSKFSVGLSG